MISNSPFDLGILLTLASHQLPSVLMAMAF